MQFLRNLIRPKHGILVSHEVKDIITRKKLQYCRFADTHQWQNMSNIAFPEATFRVFREDGKFMNLEGRDFNFASTDEFTRFVGGYDKVMTSVHMIGSGELEQTQTDEVKAIWSLVFQLGIKGPDIEHHTGGGYYHETWRRNGDDWFLRDMKLEMTFYRVIK
ncbi:hypothetical protein F5B19DRAFT_24093 [Rostrohypoxylon terebratum]|nr:hypothetical protein F5B19DRAFT_24093 [Rostrohypoxylon terebratum]